MKVKTSERGREKTGARLHMSARVPEDLFSSDFSILPSLISEICKSKEDAFLFLELTYIRAV